MDVTQFHLAADTLLETLFDGIEEADEEGRIDADLVDGVLTLVIDDVKEYVINKHEPSYQIWLSSPVSGASYFSFDEVSSKWKDNNNEITDFITQEIEGLTGLKLN